ncbi:MAG: 50S ribosomal protein L29 [Kiritimatiellia bacterium]
MKASKIREYTNEELENLLRETRQQIIDLRLKKKAASAEQPLRLHLLRRDLARIKTVMRERELKRNE